MCYNVGLVGEVTADSVQVSLPPVNQDTMQYIAGTRDDVGYFNRDAVEAVQQQQYSTNNGIYTVNV